MTREQIRIKAPIVGGETRDLPTAEVVAQNLAIHFPMGHASHVRGKPAAGAIWVVTQISSGMSAGRFRSEEAAVFFAERAVQIAPNIASGEPLTEAEGLKLGRLRSDCRGWRQ